MTPIAPSIQRRPYRAPVGMPKGRDDWRIGTSVSVLVHLGLLVLLIAPFAAGADLILREQGAGGPGPAGGGGGGKRGTGGVQAEVLRYIRVTPPPAPEIAPAKPVVPPPPKPEIQPQPQPQNAAAPVEVAPVPGVGGGTGSDTLGGSGPGSGGGVGSGIGTGRGSGVGPGTGGGTQPNYPPTPIEIFIPPMPVPNSVRGFKLIAEFDVDEQGKVRGMEFTPTPDRGYNRRLRDVLESFRFRPGTRPDGSPIRMKTQISIDLP